MSTFIKRLTIIAILILGCFYATKFGLTYRFAIQGMECMPEADRLALERKHVTEVEELRISARNLVCIANKQNFFDRMFFDARKFFDVPEKWPFPIDEYKRQLKN
jgi:hypothetical protein